MVHITTTQIDALAVAHPAGLDQLPPPIPELHHLGDLEVESEAPFGTSTRHTSSTQIGPGAVAHPAGVEALPHSIPELHHLDGSKLTSRSQLGSSAIAGYGSDDALTPSVPGLHHLDRAENLTFTGLPPFPDHVPTVPLVRIRLVKLAKRDEEEVEKLWRACCDIGFFYLDLRSAPDDNTGTYADGEGLLSAADELFSLGEAFFSLPVEEKNKYDFASEGSYFGYKGIGAGVIDGKGTKDRNEFFNTSKDDILGLSDPLPIPELLQPADTRKLFENYIRRSHAITTIVLDLLNAKLGLPQDTLRNLHRLTEPSGDQVRWVRSPPQSASDRQRALGEHTDFGSVTVLFNRLGGLQVLPPGDDQQWSYVKPLRGHCIINLGDALVKFTAGVLRSNLHRVVNPPGEQANETRLSLVYFCRPEDGVMLRIVDGSRAVDDRRERYLAEIRGEEEETSARDWTLRRALGRRGVGDFEKSIGTEGKRVEI